MARFDEPMPGIEEVFQDLVADAFRTELGRPQEPHVQAYVANLLVRFLHTDQIFAVRDASGNRLMRIADMIPEGDVRLNADSFERERQVHKHIGDFLLFWSGVFPEFLRQMRLVSGDAWIVDYTQQAKESYHLVSTFDLPPHDQEAPTFRQLSREFEAYSFALRAVRKQLGDSMGLA